MIIAIFFIFGLIIGSFLNVVIYRINLAESLMGRSHCPNCKKQIRWYDNVPLLSFVFLRGECRDCKEKISFQYPLVEFFTGVVFGLVGAYFFSAFDPQSWALAVYYLVLFSLLLVVFIYDYNFLEIPMIVFWIATGWAVLFALFSDWSNFNSQMGIWNLSVFSGLIGGFAAFAFFFILVSISKEKWMGMGDAYLAFLSGFIVGFPKIILTLILAFFIGSICSIILLAMKKKTMKSQVPFAPFLVAAVMLAIFLPQIFPEIKYYYLLF